jgi:multidrug efflux system membrane fusion protein
MNTASRVALAVGLVAALSGVAFVAAKARSSSSSSSKGAHGVGAGAGAGANGNGAAGERTVPVATFVAVRRDVPVIASGLGTVTPLATVTVKTQVDGRLERVLFKEGDDVKKGQSLAQIDPRPFAIQLQQGQAALARDQVNLKNAELNLQRYETLRQGNLIPQQQLDDQRAAVATASAATKADEAQIATAQLNLDYARIASPIDGVTGVRLVDPGNVVHPNDPSGIVIVTQLDPIAVLFTLPQDDLPRVQRALAAGKPAVEAYARDDETRLAEGELSVIDNQVDAQTATIRLKAIFPNPARRLWPNQFVKARLHIETKKDALVVPASAVQRGPQGEFVYVVGKDHTVSVKTVAVASIQGEEAILDEGIAPGDVVVTDGQNQLRPGAKVAPRPAASAAPSGAPGAAPSGRPSKAP